MLVTCLMGYFLRLHVHISKCGISAHLTPDRWRFEQETWWGFQLLPGWGSVVWHTSSQSSRLDGSACPCSACPPGTPPYWSCCPYTAVNLAATFAHSLADTFLMNRLISFLVSWSNYNQRIAFVLSCIPSQCLPHSLFPSGSSRLGWLIFSSGWTKYFWIRWSSAISQSSSAHYNGVFLGPTDDLTQVP